MRAASLQDRALPAREKSRTRYSTEIIFLSVGRRSTMPYISKSLQSCVYCIRKKLWSMLSRSFPELCTITTSDWILIMVLTSWRSQIPQNIKYCLLCLSSMCCAARFGLWPLSFPVRSCAMHCALRCILPPAQPMPKQMVHLGGSRRNPKPKRQRGSSRV